MLGSLAEAALHDGSLGFEAGMKTPRAIPSMVLRKCQRPSVWDFTDCTDPRPKTQAVVAEWPAKQDLLRHSTHKDSPLGPSLSDDDRGRSHRPSSPH